MPEPINDSLTGCLFSKIHSATVVVADQNAALDFYVNTLGWEVVADMSVMDNMRWLTVRIPGNDVELALAPESWFHDGGTKPGKSGLSLVAPNIDEAYETLTTRGVKFKKPVEMMPWGQKATWFSDPDGNEFFLVGG